MFDCESLPSRKTMSVCRHTAPYFVLSCLGVVLLVYGVELQLLQLLTATRKTFVHQLTYHDLQPLSDTVVTVSNTALDCLTVNRQEG